MGLLLCAAGAFTVCGAAFDWSWFMNHRKAQRLVALIGYTGARVFYAVFGSALFIFGVLFAAGIISSAK
ncbi:MAG: Imm17 family immunity protein [Planctomycetota bacterium]